MDKRAFLVGIVGAVAAFFIFRGSTPAKRVDPSSAVPDGSFLVATVDVAELRRSPITTALLGDDPKSPSVARMFGMGEIERACGFDPSTRVTKVAVAVPEESVEKGEFGAIAQVEVSRDELETCTRKLGEGHGAQREVRQAKGFAILETKGEPDAARFAYGKGGLLVVGKGTWFDAMLDAANRSPKLPASIHGAIRASLTSHEGWKSPTILASAILPSELRQRIKRETSAETSDPSNSLMAGVLDVVTVGLAVKAGPRGGTVDAAIELGCETEEACAAVERLVSKKRFDLSKDLTLRMVGLGGLLDSFEIHRNGKKIRATASGSADSLASTLERVLRFRRHRSEPLDPSPRFNPPPPKPDEILGQKDGG